MLDDLPDEWRGTGWLQSEVQRISRRIEGLGPVNLAALDALNPARERKEFLDSQYPTLTEAIETVDDALRKIDRETRDLLPTKLATVNQKSRYPLQRHIGQVE